MQSANLRPKFYKEVKTHPAKQGGMCFFVYNTIDKNKTMNIIQASISFICFVYIENFVSCFAFNGDDVLIPYAQYDSAFRDSAHFHSQAQLLHGLFRVH